MYLTRGELLVCLSVCGLGIQYGLVATTCFEQRLYGLVGLSALFGCKRSFRKRLEMFSKNCIGSGEGRDSAYRLGWEG